MYYSVAIAHLDDAKVIELNPSSYLGYQLEHAALHGAGSYDEAVEAFQDMLSKLDSAPDPHLRSKHCKTHATTRLIFFLQNCASSISANPRQKAIFG